jgi:hypothetical protein
LVFLTTPSSSTFLVRSGNKRTQGITKLKLIAGTATVLDDEARLQEEHTVHDPNLKYDPTGQIILVPQPSNDPNDPLVRILRGYPNIRIDLD